MKKTIINGALGLFAAIALVCICSEPATGTSLGAWILWESAWMTALILDAKLFDYLDKKSSTR